ncbi:hypothetical protein [Rhodococcus sp. IEGM 1379]|nr:hypothetical protein [Rhodococcus sp. IEGM 1379]MDI9917723.1 hypothetical protein [Rhodococcus sp. IEGM 1379]
MVSVLDPVLDGNTHSAYTEARDSLQNAYDKLGVAGRSELAETLEKLVR